MRRVSEITRTRPAGVSGMLAIAVMRCSQNASVPDFAEPRPRTRPSGVRMLMSIAPSSHAEHHEDQPQQDDRRDRADDVGTHQPFALRRLPAVADGAHETGKGADQMTQSRP